MGQPVAAIGDITTDIQVFHLLTFAMVQSIVS